MSIGQLKNKYLMTRGSSLKFKTTSRVYDAWTRAVICRLRRHLHKPVLYRQERGIFRIILLRDI